MKVWPATRLAIRCSVRAAGRRRPFSALWAVTRSTRRPSSHFTASMWADSAAVKALDFLVRIRTPFKPERARVEFKQHREWRQQPMERMTSVNAWAICLSGFVLGALASWGVFYEYRCASGVKPLDASAWAQVLVAAVVGASAVFVPKQIANSEKRRRSEIFIQLLDNVLQSSHSLATCLVAKAPDPHIIDGLIRDIEMQSKALESYPISEIPSAALLMLRVEGKSHYDALFQLAHRLVPMITNVGHVYPNQVNAVLVYRNAIAEVMHSIDDERP